MEENKVNRVNKSNKIKPKFSIYWIYAIILLVFIGLNFFDFSSKKEEIDWERLKEMIVSNEVKKLVIVNREVVEIYLSDNAVNNDKYKKFREKNSFSSGPQYYLTILSIDAFQQNLDKLQLELPSEQRVPTKTETRKDIFGDLLTWLLPLIVIIAIWMFVFRKMAGGGGGGAGGIFNIGKSRAKVFDKDS